MAVRTCSARQGEQTHCYHVDGTPVQGAASVIFDNVCCFCAPEWMHKDIYVPETVNDEDLVAEQMKHGPLITMHKTQKRNKLAGVNGRFIA